MNGARQGWLVARREIRERSRSRAFQASVVLMIVGVIAVLILPVLLKPSSTRDIGITGSAPAALAATIAQQPTPPASRPAYIPTPASPPASRPSAKGASTPWSPARGGWSGKASPTSSSRPW
jgi:hypothetical protein